MFVSVGGAVLFANVNPYIATLLPLTVMSKIMMNHPMSTDFIRRIQRVQDQDDFAYGRNHNTTKLRAGCINIFSPELARNGMPPADTSTFVYGEYTSIECRGHEDTPDGESRHRLAALGIQQRDHHARIDVRHHQDSHSQTPRDDDGLTSSSRLDSRKIRRV
jgi:hypothetical protein